MTLWFFRTKKDNYGLSMTEPDSICFGQIDAYDYAAEGAIYLGASHPGEGFPPLQPGECIPVTLVAEGKGGAKKERKK